MSPDLLYYLPGPAEGSHTVVGVLGKDLVLGLAALVAWQAFVGRAVAALAPPSVGRRLAGYPVGLRRSLGRPPARTCGANHAGNSVVRPRGRA